jgi:hypothetical protein
MQKHPLHKWTHPHDLVTGIIRPESPLETNIIQHPDWLAGAFWGEPRWGHPEGQVIFHIQEVLANIDRLQITPQERLQLRFIALVHDNFKHIEDRSTPRDWSKHHAVYARQFAQQYTTDPALLNVIELHDEAYYAWRLHALYRDPPKAFIRLNRLLTKITHNRNLYYQFFVCDTRTGDKTLLPIEWFEEMVPNLPIIRW